MIKLRIDCLGVVFMSRDRGGMAAVWEKAIGGGKG
jgi:hypothetical protein